MIYAPRIFIDHSRIEYELKTHSQSIVMVSAETSEEVLMDALHELRAKYADVSIDCDGDIIINDSE